MKLHDFFLQSVLLIVQNYQIVSDFFRGPTFLLLYSDWFFWTWRSHINLFFIFYDIILKTLVETLFGPSFALKIDLSWIANMFFSSWLFYSLTRSVVLNCWFSSMSISCVTVFFAKGFWFFVVVLLLDWFEDGGRVFAGCFLLTRYGMRRTRWCFIFSFSHENIIQKVYRKKVRW